jgi:hypothetical protein
MRIRYSLSHILLVVTIVALICGWIIDHKRIADENKALKVERLMLPRIAIDGLVRVQSQANQLVQYVQTTQTPSLDQLARKALSVQQACIDGLNRLPKE